jgi:hypothetical protein
MKVRKVYQIENNRYFKLNKKILAMKHIIIDATNNSPKVELNPEGEMILQGRSILEDTNSFYNPIIDWVKNYTSEKFVLEVRMEYVNTSSSKQLFTLLQTLKSNPFIKEVNVKWFYEVDDEDMLDMGKDYQSMINLPIDFYEYYENVA